MRNRKCLATGFFLVVFQPLVQIQWIGGTEGWLCRQGYYLSRAVTVVTQNHVAVQVETLGHRGPFETDQGSKLAWIIKLIGSIDNIVPKVVINLRTRRVV